MRDRLNKWVLVARNTWVRLVTTPMTTRHTRWVGISKGLFEAYTKPVLCPVCGAPMLEVLAESKVSTTDDAGNAYEQPGETTSRLPYQVLRELNLTEVAGDYTQCCSRCNHVEHQPHYSDRS